VRATLNTPSFVLADDLNINLLLNAVL